MVDVGRADAETGVLGLRRGYPLAAANERHTRYDGGPGGRRDDLPGNPDRALRPLAAICLAAAARKNLVLAVSDSLSDKLDYHHAGLWANRRCAIAAAR